MSAYGKTKAIAAIIERVQPAVKNRRIMLRFRLDDLIKGSTDFDVLDYCRNLGWSVFIRFDLHAKTYIIDNKRGIVGSANATNSGLSLSNFPNYEIAALVDVEEKDVEKIDALFMDALSVDDDLWMALNSEYKNVKKKGYLSEPFQWSKAISERFTPHIRTLFSYEFPDKASYRPGEYIQFLDMGYSGSINELKSALRWSTAYLWLLDQVVEKNGEVYFGELSGRLHNSLVTDPKPYRKDVKVLLSNLLQLIISVDMPEIGIDRPNHSQRVFLK